ncbi:hypothetical protein JCM19039_3302 [Geomicrobium sp. JCM 19039]|nr:hypothetical protein JCM19039_3302 [Geomicrobium sp. JCM 19039]
MIASDTDGDEYIGSLSFTLGKEEDDGKLVVRTKENIAFDVTDLSSYKRLLIV